MFARTTSSFQEVACSSAVRTCRAVLRVILYPGGKTPHTGTIQARERVQVGMWNGVYFPPRRSKRWKQQSFSLQRRQYPACACRPGGRSYLVVGTSDPRKCRFLLFISRTRQRTEVKHGRKCAGGLDALGVGPVRFVRLSLFGVGVEENCRNSVEPG